MLPVNQILQGSAIERLKELPDNSIDTCITSPPYWALRDYKVDGQLGSEPTFHQYLDDLIAIFAEVKRVIKPTGSIWVNIGDTYSRTGGSNQQPNKHYTLEHIESQRNALRLRKVAIDAPEKSLCGIPERFALKMTDELGLIRRNTVIWYKPNCLDQNMLLYAKTQKGITIQTLKDLVRLLPETVELWDGQKWNKVIQWIRNDNPQNILEITLRNGEQIRVTGDHLIPTNGTNVRAADLKIGDILTGSNFHDCNKTIELVPDDIGWFIGLYLAEGSISGDGAIQISSHTSEIARYDKLTSICKKYGANCHRYVQEGNNTTLKVSSTILRGILDTYIAGSKAHLKHLSTNCWNRNNHFLANILMGYLSGDGHFENDNNRWRLGFTRNRYLASDLRTICARLGYGIKLQKAFARIGTAVFKTYKGEIRFSHSNHHNIKSDLEITNIEKSDGGIFYDIQLSEDPHLFATASGTLIHNCMPSSASDRFTVDFEYIYFFTKSQRYFFETQYEPIKESTNERNKYSRTHKVVSPFDKREYRIRPHEENPLGRIKRCVWRISTKPFSGAHFAVYPQQLIEPIVKAACPEWICSVCGKPRKLVYEEKQLIPTRPGLSTKDGVKSRTEADPNKGLHESDWSKYKPQVVRMPKFGGNRASEYGNPTYSGKEWNPTLRRIKKYNEYNTKETNRSMRERPGCHNDIVIRRLKSMGSDNKGNYDGQSTKDYDSAMAQDASETKRRILESYKRRATSDIVMMDCGCGASFDNGICLDPFFGAGTTGLVALQLGRKFIGIELSKDYINIAMKRLKPYLDQSTLTEFVDQQ